MLNNNNNNSNNNRELNLLSSGEQVPFAQKILIFLLT